jgi:hypothetical protein
LKRKSHVFKSIQDFFASLTTNHLDGLLKVVPAIFVVTGVLLVFAGNIWVNAPTGTALSTIGVTVLGSGVFAAMLKYFQFIGVFKTELQELLRSPQVRRLLIEHHLDAKKQGSDIYEHAAERTISEQYPDLTDAFNASRGNYSDGEFDYYFDAFERVITVQSFDGTTGVVEIDDETAIVLVAPTKAGINYSFDILRDLKAKAESFRIVALSIDNQNAMAELKETPGSFSFSRELKGKHRYRIRRKASQRYLLRFDPIKTHIFNRITKDATVRVRNECPDALEFDFFQMNSKRPWVVTPLIETKAAEYSHHFPNLLFPHQGYYIIFRERASKAAATPNQSSGVPAVPTARSNDS